MLLTHFITDAIKNFQNEQVLILNYPLTHGIDLDDITLGSRMK